jgi:hypothetical protein
MICCFRENGQEMMTSMIPTVEESIALIHYTITRGPVNRPLPWVLRTRDGGESGLTPAPINHFRIPPVKPAGIRAG